MGNRKPKPPPARPARFRAARPILAVLFTLGVVAALLFGLGELGDEARRRVGPRDRYAARFADLQCDSPAGLDRLTFLAEVRYASAFPDTLNLLDPDLSANLTAGFAAHPWVESVEGVAVEAPATVRVRLRFRVPVLAVRVEGGVIRAVDAHGVLLPLSAATVGLPELVNPVAPPTAPAGQVWGEELVKRAVDLVKAYRPTRLERTPAGWRLTLPGGKTLLVVL